MRSPEATIASPELVRAIADGPVLDLTVAVAVLAGIEPATLEPDDQVDLVRAYDRCQAALDAAKTRAIAAVADSYQALGMPASGVVGVGVGWGDDEQARRHRVAVSWGQR